MSRSRPRSGTIERLITAVLLPAALNAAVLITNSNGQAAPATPPPSTAPAKPASPSASDAPAELPAIAAPAPAPGLGAFAGRPVTGVRLEGNATVSTAEILAQIRTRQGEPFDPLTVQEDYQRIYSIGRFADVQARAEPFGDGVLVSFAVTERQQITQVRFEGNDKVSTKSLEEAAGLRVGEAADPFRVNLARTAVQDLYRQKRYPYAAVTVAPDALNDRSEVVIRITEGPKVTVRRVLFEGNDSFTADRLRGVVGTKAWFPIFRPGRLDSGLLDADVAQLRRFYQGKGFFDARIGRRLEFSQDQSRATVRFVIDEGVRYQVSSIEFVGNTSLPDARLRENLRMLEGLPYNAELVQRDLRELVRAYSPLGFIFQPQSRDPDYLRIDPRTVFRPAAGELDLVYEISEGKPFEVGQIMVRGNSRTQDKVVLREMRVVPGDKFNSGAVLDATERLRGSPYFESVSITPVGGEPGKRDILIEVKEKRTASLNVGAGFNSNGGLGLNFVYQQENFDIADFPESPMDPFTGNAFVGAGQRLRLEISPGTEQTNLSVQFTEPWLFDQPYSLGVSLYYRQYKRNSYDDQRMGTRVSLGHRINNRWSMSGAIRAEQILIDNINDPTEAPPEYILAQGYSALTSVSLTARRSSITGGSLPYRGSSISGSGEMFGALGGDYTFPKLTASYDLYRTLREDLLERRVILGIKTEIGYIFDDAPFFERFYGGGIGSVRGFAFRGISPRSGVSQDAIGGDFSLFGTAEVSYPMAGESVRGVVFVDAGTVEEGFEINTLRVGVGTGLRIVWSALGQIPIAIDFAYPVNKDDLDDTRIVSFSFGFLP